MPEKAKRKSRTNVKSKPLHYVWRSNIRSYVCNTIQGTASHSWLCSARQGLHPLFCRSR